MKKTKQWEKPQLGVVSCSKPGAITSSSRSGRAQYYLGPAPSPAPADGSGKFQYYLGPAPESSPADSESFRSGRAQYHLGPAPAPV